MIKIKLDEDCVGGTVIKWSQYNDDDVFNYNDKTISLCQRTLGWWDMGQVGFGLSRIGPIARALIGDDSDDDLDNSGKSNGN